MSDSLPEGKPLEVLKVLKLISGEEVMGLVTEADSDYISMEYPALLQNYFTKDNNGNMIECIKLLNYLSNIKNYKIQVSKKLVIFIGEPAPELYQMYQLYHAAMTKDPKSVMSIYDDEILSTEPGLQLLNDLFNNEDFVEFVNDLMDTYEGSEVSEDDEDDVESVIEPPEEEEAPSPPKRKKRRKVKPETNKMPYNPEAPPTNPESWSDNPMDYM